MVPQVGSFLLCSHGFFQWFGLLCHHLFVVLVRGPKPSDCATKWRRDYLAYSLSGKAELDLLFKEAKMQKVVAFLLATLNDLNILAADIQNAYLNAPTTKKV
jgi:hypothetical protein